MCEGGDRRIGNAVFPDHVPSCTSHFCHQQSSIANHQSVSHTKPPPSLAHRAEGPTHASPARQGWGNTTRARQLRAESPTQVLTASIAVRDTALPLQHSRFSVRYSTFPFSPRKRCRFGAVLDKVHGRAEIGVVLGKVHDVVCLEHTQTR